VGAGGGGLAPDGTGGIYIAGHDATQAGANEDCQTKIYVGRFGGDLAALAGWPVRPSASDGAQSDPALAGHGRPRAHVPAGATNTFPLDAGNYIHDYWGEGREATYADFPLLGRGPFGEAIRIRQETDATFRPLLFVPRARLHRGRGHEAHTQGPRELEVHLLGEVGGFGVGTDTELSAGARLNWKPDRKSTRLNSSHLGISYAVFCLKKKKKKKKRKIN